MAHIRLDDKRIELSAGDTWIGSSGEAIVRFDAGPEKGILAINIVDPSGTATVRRVSAGATILLNGVAHMRALPCPKVASTADAECPRAPRNNAVVSREAPTLPTLEAANDGTSRRLVSPFRAVLAHIGRGKQNDVIVADVGLSTSDVRIQRRESGWFVANMLSTNGIHASGDRAPVERARKANRAVHFGGVKVIFRSSRRSPQSRPQWSAARPSFS